jgi:hypothetical protein
MSAAEEYQDQEKVRDWLIEQSVAVEAYLKRQNVRSEPPEPRWELAPYIAIWELCGGWAISGDLPTDYVLDETIRTAREALQFFADKFADLAECMLTGRPYPGTTIGNPNDPEQQRKLGELLRNRAVTLAEFAQNDGLWPEGADHDESPEDPK